MRLNSVLKCRPCFLLFCIVFRDGANFAEYGYVCRRMDRIHYLKELKRVLKSGGLFYLQNGLNIESVIPENKDEAEELQIMKEFLAERPSQVKRKIETEQGKTEIVLPVLPNKLLSMEEYEEEVTNAGFTVLSAKQGGRANMSYEAILVAQS